MVFAAPIGLFGLLCRIFIVVIFNVFFALNTFAANKQNPNDLTSDLSSTVKGIVTITDKEGNRLEDHSNVVVFVDGLSEKQINSAKSAVSNMSHKGLRFTPRVLPITKGTNVNFLNDDRIFHNVFSLSKAKPFDLGIYPSGSEKLVQFDQPGLVKVYCNIHPNMISNVLVLNNPLFSKTDTNGNYEINNIPKGKIILRVWHEYGDDVRREIDTQNREQIIENFILSNSKNINKHKNKFGMPYRQKY